MKVAIALVLSLAVAASAGVIAPATTLVRTPSLDSAVIQSDRLGGNFAYSSVEGHAYAAISPVVQNVVQPVGVSYTAHQVPVGVAYSPAVVAAAPAQAVVAAPAPILAAAPGPAVISSPVAAYYPSLIGAPALPAGPTPVADAPAPAPIAPAAPAAPAAPSPGSDDAVAVESA